MIFTYSKYHLSLSDYPRAGCVFKPAASFIWISRNAMLLNIPVEDLLVSQLDIKLDHADGRLSCKLRPNSHNGSAPKSWAGITLNLESVYGDNGYILNLYASLDERALPVTPSDSPTASTSPNDCLSFNSHNDTGLLSTAIEVDDGYMAFLLSDTSLSSDYMSSSNQQRSLTSTDSRGYECDSGVDFASTCTSREMCNNDGQQFSQCEFPRLVPSVSG